MPRFLRQSEYKNEIGSLIRMNRVFVLALAGAVIIILVALFFVSVGVAYSGVLSNFGFTVTEGKYSFADLHPDIARYETIRYSIYGALGLSAGAMGLIGGRIGKVKGGIVLIVSSVISIGAFALWGLVSFVLLLASGIMAITQRSTARQETTNLIK